ncbi:MAG: hypothetical protein M1819_005569 [Sarea resinae]|nr:MAG: hypothetical protein M1819_005569 [Sarea resinae]
MANLDYSGEGLIGLDYDPRGQRFSYVPRASWPMPMEQNVAQNPTLTRNATAPLQSTGGNEYQQQATSQSSTLLTDWQIQQAAQLAYAQDATPAAPQFTGPFNAFQTSPIDYMSATQAPMDASLQMDGSFLPLAGSFDGLPFTWSEFSSELLAYPNASEGLTDASLAPQNLPDSSPTDTYLEVRSLTSSSSDNGWAAVDYRQSYDSSYSDPQNGAIFNPSQTLHIRTQSDSSHSDIDHSRYSFGSSFEEVPYPLNSPESDTQAELLLHAESAMMHNHQHDEHGHCQAAILSPSAAVDPVPIKKSQSARTSPKPGSGSPSARRGSRKSPIAKATKPVIRRPSTTPKKDTEKRVGRRRGPLRPDQRKQASEIRKLRACLRCKFLKKTCDKGEPCAGCQPSHARLWQVPCTRIDIKDIGYFMKDWKADFERHASLGFSVSNIKGFAPTERSLFITHGYGYFLPITAREVYVRDERCFGAYWTETTENNPKMPQDYAVTTAKLSAGVEGISRAQLSEYLDRHIDGGFDKFVDDFFDGTPFLTEILKTAYRYYLREKLPVIRKALKLVLAYNLTMHVTLVEDLSEEDRLPGKIYQESSKFRGKTAAPVMINFQVKFALAEMWRELQKDILEELSSLYSSVYSGDKLKNWPTIFMLAAILLAVWEEMQFDCHYRVPDEMAVQKFCNDMETTPVGVIVGLFSAISQKLPSISEWDTRKHHHLLNSNHAVCDAMTEMREHVSKYETYLKKRSESKFDRQDFDCLSNKFLAKLVIRSN